MATLILKDNGLLNKESGTALGNMLKSNTVLTKLDVSDNAYDSDEDDAPGFAQELAIGIKDNGAMSSLNLATNALGQDGALIICDALLGSRYAVCTFYAGRVQQLCVFWLI